MPDKSDNLDKSGATMVGRELVDRLPRSTEASARRAAIKEALRADLAPLSSQTPQLENESSSTSLKAARSKAEDEGQNGSQKSEADIDPGAGTDGVDDLPSGIAPGGKAAKLWQAARAGRRVGDKLGVWLEKRRESTRRMLTRRRKKLAESEQMEAVAEHLVTKEVVQGRPAELGYRIESMRRLAVEAADAGLSISDLREIVAKHVAAKSK